MAFHLIHIKMEKNKTYLEKRKELEDVINLLNIKQRRIPPRGNNIYLLKEKSKLEKEIAELDVAEMEKCKNDPHYFVTTYMTINGNPIITMLDKEAFNREAKPTEEDINKWFVIRRGRRNER